MSFFKTLGETIPFFDESSVSRIRADIKKKSRETQSPKNSDHLFNAGLFLQIAQEFDMQSWEISKDLQFCENMEQDLIKNLKGENDSSYKGIIGNKAFITDDPGSFMIPERIKAWTYLMDYDQAQHNHEIPGLFITSSRAAFEHLIDKAPDAKKLFCFDTIPVHKNRVPELKEWQAGLMQRLDILAENEWDGSVDGIDKAPADQRCEKKISLTLYIVPREAPREFFARFIEHKLARPREKNQRARFKNTIIGLIET